MFSISPAAEEKAELQFSHTRIVAAADGVIAKKTVEITSRPRKSAQKGCVIIKPAYEVRSRKDDQSLLAKVKQSAQVLKFKKREQQKRLVRAILSAR